MADDNTHKMDPEIKKQWVEALRSGKYKQVRNELYHAPPKKAAFARHCCLAVLDDISGLGDWHAPSGTYRVLLDKAFEMGEQYFSLWLRTYPHPEFSTRLVEVLCDMGIVTHEASLQELYDVLDQDSLKELLRSHESTFQNTYVAESAFLHPLVRLWAGLGTDNPVVVAPDGGQTSLADLNDGGWTFEDIANIIEDQL